jgi:hypothetical protein
MATSGTYYIDTDSFSTATAVWTDSGLTTKAPDGYYSFGGNYRQQFNGLLQAIQSCDVAPTGYKIRSFLSNTSTTQVVCDTRNYIDYTETITIQLTENDGTTPKINLTGGDIIINFVREERACFGESYRYPTVITIAPGQSETYIYNTGVTNNCGGTDCVVVVNEYECYSSITPSSVVPTLDFFPICVPSNECISYTINRVAPSGSGASEYRYVDCDGVTRIEPFTAETVTFCAQLDSIIRYGIGMEIVNNGLCS